MNQRDRGLIIPVLAMVAGIALLVCFVVWITLPLWAPD
jgi:hypothetical protein